MVRIEGDEDPIYYRSQNVMRDDLFNWIRSRSLPLLPEFRGRAYNDIVRSGKLTLLFALDSSALIDNEQIAQLKQVVRSLPISVECAAGVERSSSASSRSPIWTATSGTSTFGSTACRPSAFPARW